jgi:transposase
MSEVDKNINEQNSKIKTNYTQDFKDQIICVYKSGIYNTIKDCANAYNISPKTLSNWWNAYNKNIVPNSISEQQLELAKLKKELTRAKMENEILKKAAIYFANQAQ